jgi:hypothetical protein
MNSLIGVLITFVVVILILYLVNNLPIDRRGKQIVRVIVIVVSILSMLKYLAVFWLRRARAQMTQLCAPCRISVAYALHYDILKDFEPVSRLPVDQLLIVAKNSVAGQREGLLIAWLHHRPHVFNQVNHIPKPSFARAAGQPLNATYHLVFVCGGTTYAQKSGLTAVG